MLANMAARLQISRFGQFHVRFQIDVFPTEKKSKKMKHFFLLSFEVLGFKIWKSVSVMAVVLRQGSRGCECRKVKI